jgi:hypothetical protein
MKKKGQLETNIKNEDTNVCKVPEMPSEDEVRKLEQVRYLEVLADKEIASVIFGDEYKYVIYAYQGMTIEERRNITLRRESFANFCINTDLKKSFQNFLQPEFKTNFISKHGQENYDLIFAAYQDAFEHKAKS